MSPDLSPAREALLDRRRRGAGGNGHSAVQPRTAGTPVPLSSQQQRLWFLDQLVPHSAFANIDVALRLEFAVDPALLQRCVDEIVRRHESLRTTFRSENGALTQVVAPRLEVPVRVVDLGGAGAGADAGAGAGAGAGADAAASLTAAVKAAVTAQAREPFDLSRGPLLRVTLLRETSARWVLVITVHHIVADGWSMRLFFAELAALYTAFATRAPSPLPDVVLQYPDYAVWQQERLSGPTLDRQLDYWRTQLDGLPVLELPTDRPRPPVQTFAGARLTFDLAADDVRRLADLVAAEGATVFMGLLAVFAHLVSRWSGQDDLAIGSYIAGRTRVELEPLIGFFVNTVVLRTRLDGEPGLVEALRRVRTSALGAYDHQDVPFEKLVEALDPPRDLSRNPLCQVAFQLVTAPAGTSTGPTPATVEAERGTASFDLVWSATLRADGGASGSLEYDTALFDRLTMERLVDRFSRLLRAATLEPERPLAELDLTTGAERRQVAAWNSTATPVDPTGLADLFRARAAASPQATAVLVDGGDSWSYADVAARAADLAGRLDRLGVEPGAVVGVLLERSPEWVAAAVAVATIGAVYLPLDPAYPPERLAFMARDSGAVALVSVPALLDGWDGPELPCVRADGRPDDAGPEDARPGPVGASPAPAPVDPARPRPRSGPDDPAYVVYTSGSTGQPKGVVAPVRQVLNRLQWMWQTYPFAPGEVGALRTPIGFVDSLWELWGPLLQGVPSVVVEHEARADAERLLDMLARHRVTRLWLVPSLLRALLVTHPDLGSALPDLRMWVLSGEPLAAELADRFHAAAPAAQLHNAYGTSEVWDATWHVCEPGEPVIALGRPIANVACLVLDPAGRAVPLGMPGELCVGGAGLTSGYLGQPELTARRFVAAPDGGPGRWYRTGDRARWNSAGELEFLGRLDEQLKVRGMRVEPGDVEAALADLPGLADVAVAITAVAPGQASLTAHLVLEPGAPVPTLVDVRRHLARRVPDPAIPTRLVVLASLPRTSSGKLDRRALPVPDPHDDAASTAPGTPLETLIQAVWQDVLGQRSIGTQDRFFELGGHSLLATQIVSRLRQLLDVDLPLQLFFEAPTIGELASALTDGPDADRIVRIAEVAVALLNMTEDEVATALAAPDSLAEP